MMDFIGHDQLGYAISILLVVCTTSYYYIKKKISDKVLFQEPPPKEDCLICMLPMPYTIGAYGCGTNKMYMSCCGKTICHGCIMATAAEVKKGNIKKWCPFCRIPIAPTDKEALDRIEKRVKFHPDDADAYFALGGHYVRKNGWEQKRPSSLLAPQDLKKVIEAWQKAARLGSVCGHYNLGTEYHKGVGVEQDIGKAIHHWELAAIGGHEQARSNLGALEYNNGNVNRAMKHYMIAARCGIHRCLKYVGEGYKAGHVTKDEYEQTIRAYQSTHDEMNSKQRTKATAIQEAKTKSRLRWDED